MPNDLLPSPNIHNQPHHQNRQLPQQYRSPEIPYYEQLKLCQSSVHEKPRQEFISASIEYDTCNQCRRDTQQWRQRQEEQSLQEQTTPSFEFEDIHREELERLIGDYLDNERNGSMLFCNNYSDCLGLGLGLV